ncbi:acetate--CoA ligase family protein [Actinomadura madurae]|nr:acetate--CoA ligase family protein [Actinomadura madurae]MCP9968350.1 acetate--CoA ligase family protein [Actinomadura madurae]MCP9980817.1 acetate--CoA ligase family protein [Actinomadura madurae]MCQ0007687.1 acetate--CoA ligase family protein [Actinomadura madurae]MCQ0017008.1 acetate--CoA ligase family protein [Actinomadura madurae]
MKPSSDYFSATRAVAVVGASERNFYATMAIRNLDAYGFDGEILPVHREGGTLLGHKVHPDVAGLPVDPDLAVLGVSAARAPEAIGQLAERGCRRVVLIADGYIERADELGAARTAELRAACERLGIELVGPNGIGVACFTDGLVPICEPVPAGIRAGRVSVVSHSGALISGILDGFVTEDVGVNAVVSVGNGTVIGLLDWIDWMVDDPGTGTVACYAENIDDLGRFRDIAGRAASTGTLIVLLAVGRSALARDIALSHTASIAGDHDLLEAVCADTGVVLVPDVETMVTVCHLHERRLAGDLADGSGPVVITSSGGAATLTADLAGDGGLRLPELGEASRSLLGGLVSASGYVGNPMDLTASGGLDGPARLRLYESLLSDEGTTGGLYVLGVNFPGDEDFRSMHREMLGSLATSTTTTGRHVVVAGVADQQVTDWVGRLVRDTPGLGLVRSLRRATAALGVLQRRTRHRRQAPWEPRMPAAPASASSWVSEPQAKELLAARGLPVVRGLRLGGVAGIGTARLPGPGPYAVKAVVRDVGHKARLGLVRLGARDRDEVRSAAEAIERSVDEHALADRFEGLLVEEMVNGFEVMVSTRWAKGLPFLTLALGGTLVEALRTGASVPLPWHPKSWDSLTERSGLRRVLDALPAGGGATVRRICEEIADEAVHGGLARFGTVELNPVIVSPDGGAHIVDALLL